MRESLENLREVCVFEVKWPKAKFTTSNPILKLKFISISPMTLIILEPTPRGNKNTLEEINVL